MTNIVTRHFVVVSTFFFALFSKQEQFRITAENVLPNFVTSVKGSFQLTVFSHLSSVSRRRGSIKHANSREARRVTVPYKKIGV